MTAPPLPLTLGRRLSDYLALTKPKIIVLLLITGACAMLVAKGGGVPGPRLLLVTLLGLGLSCGGANAMNMWYDRDIDPIMNRTRNRPIPSGRMRPGAALTFGIAAQVASILLLGLLVNWLAAVLSLAGFVYYVFIYTMWLKRRTPQNIVIGGGAGAFPPLVGWAAVTGQVGIAALLMFLIIFMWTPPHFWSLALYKDEDYRRAGIPMMPVVRGWQTTKWQSLAYSVLLLAASMLLYWTGVVGLLYLVAAVVLGAVFIGYSLVLLREPKPEVKWAKRTFRFSLLYLTAIFAVMVLNVRH
ncbi:MAG TPA: heme o synthase [Bacillota bacterium]|nr:heme o synthase [Bacillota bacterium]